MPVKMNSSVQVSKLRRYQKINPVTRIAKGDWQRLSAGKTVPMPDGRADAVWETNIIADSMDFAFCFPYGVPEMDEVVEKSKGYFKKDIIGISPEGRDIVRLNHIQQID